MACLIVLGLSAWAPPVRAQQQAAAPDPIYQVFGFNDLGMHCYDGDFSVFCLLPPFNTIHAQVVNKGLKPVLLTGSTVKVTYAATADPSGSINTTSIGKTNFWTYIGKLFGPSFNNWPLDVGILGYKMPSAAYGPQTMTPYDPAYNWFSATGIPLINHDDAGQVNCLPMMKIRAQSNLGLVPNNSLDIVLPSSSEMNCASCHETAALANGTTTFSDASPPPRLTTLTPTDFSYNPNPVLRYRQNVLILHDALGSYGGVNPSYPGYISAAYPGFNTLVDVYKSGKPVLCATCHYSKALDLAGTGPTALQAPHLYLSRAMHKHHGTAWPTGSGGMGMGGTYTIPIPGAYTLPATPTECYYCHPGNDTQCLRSVMATNGMSCQNCHGDLLAIAGFTPQLATDGFVDPYLPNVSDQVALRVNLTTTGTTAPALAGYAQVPVLPFRRRPGSPGAQPRRPDGL